MTVKRGIRLLAFDVIVALADELAGSQLSTLSANRSLRLPGQSYLTSGSSAATCRSIMRCICISN